MALIWWRVGLAVLGFAILMLIVGAVLARLRSSRTGIVLAHPELIRTLPRWRALERRRRRLLRWQLVCWLLAILGLAVTVARPASLGSEEESRQTRDVVLCLDVSSSMTTIDKDIIDTYLGLIDRLGHERIGLVVFDRSAITVFPLTQDQDQARAHLREVRDQLGHGPIAGTTYGKDGSSLVGDGTAACLSRFDNSEGRSRTVVLATDNLVSGAPLYSLDEAIDLAANRQIMVLGIAPSNDDQDALDALRAATARTGGSTVTVAGGRPADVSTIGAAITRQRESALPAMESATVTEHPELGIALFCVGTLGAEILRRRTR